MNMGSATEFDKKKWLHKPSKFRGIILCNSRNSLISDMYIMEKREEGSKVAG